MTIENAKAALRVEAIRPGMGEATSLDLVFPFVKWSAGACAARGFSTGTVTIDPRAVLPYHVHHCLVRLSRYFERRRNRSRGRARLSAGAVRLHLPSRRRAHQISNGSGDSPLMALSAVASPTPAQGNP